MGEEIFHELDGGRSNEYDEDSGEDEEDEGEDHFDGGLLSFFFCELSSFDSHGFRVDAE